MKHIWWGAVGPDITVRFYKPQQKNKSGSNIMTGFPYDPFEPLGSQFFTKRRSLEDAANRVGPARTALATGAHGGPSQQGGAQRDNLPQPFTLNAQMRARIEARRKAAAALKTPITSQSNAPDSGGSERERVDGYIKSLMQRPDYWKTGPDSTALKDTVQKLWQTAYPNPARTDATGRSIQDEQPATTLNELIAMSPVRNKNTAPTDIAERESNSSSLFKQTESETEEPPDPSPSKNDKCEALQIQYLELRKIDKKLDEKRYEYQTRLKEIHDLLDSLNEKDLESYLSLAPPTHRMILDALTGNKPKTRKKSPRNQLENILNIAKIGEREKERIELNNEIDELTEKIKKIDDQKEEIKVKKTIIQTKASDINCIILDS